MPTILESDNAKVIQSVLDPDGAGSEKSIYARIVDVQWHKKKKEDVIGLPTNWLSSPVVAIFTFSYGFV